MELIQPCYTALPVVVLISVCVCATWTDLKGRTISNQVLYAAILVGIVYFSLSARLETEFPGLASFAILAKSFPQAMLGATACGLALLPFWHLGGIGGGDVKLVAALGMYLGPDSGFAVIFLGSLIALIFLAGSRLVKWIGQRAGKARPQSNEGHKATRDFELPMAGFLSIATLIVVTFPII